MDIPSQVTQPRSETCVVVPAFYDKLRTKGSMQRQAWVVVRRVETLVMRLQQDFALGPVRSSQRSVRGYKKVIRHGSRRMLHSARSREPHLLQPRPEI